MIQAGEASTSEMTSMSAIPISCYIRTLNESRNITRVVLAAKMVASEVVVIDAGSTDATVALAKAAGARVIHNDWPGNGYQKRVGEEACSHDWLLDIDGDEVITPNLAAAILDLFRNGEPAESVYEIKMIHAPPVGQPWWTFNPTWRCKLYDRRQNRMPAHAVWDQLDLAKSVKTPRLDGVLLHYAFRDLSHVIAKANTRSTRRATFAKRRSKANLAMRVWGAFPVYFAKHFLARGLWHAGTYGMIFAFNAAHARWLRDAKMYEMLLMQEQQSATAVGVLRSDIQSA